MWLRPVNRAGGIIIQRAFCPLPELSPTTAVLRGQMSGQAFDEINQPGSPARLFFHSADPGGAGLFLKGAQPGPLLRLLDAAAHPLSPLVQTAYDARLPGKRLPMHEFRRGDESPRPVAHRGLGEPLHQLAPAKVVLDYTKEAQQQPSGGRVLQGGWVRSGHRQAGQAEFEPQLVSVGVGLPVECSHAVKRRAVPGFPQHVPDCAADFLPHVGSGNDAVRQKLTARLVGPTGLAGRTVSIKAFFPPGVCSNLAMGR